MKRQPRPNEGDYKQDRNTHRGLLELVELFQSISTGKPAMKAGPRRTDVLLSRLFSASALSSIEQGLNSSYCGTPLYALTLMKDWC